MLHQAQQYFYLARYTQAIAVLKGIAADEPDYGSAQALHLRCLFVQGHIGEALQVANDALQHRLTLDDQLVLQLWHRLIHLYTQLPRPSDVDWQALDSLCEQIVEMSNAAVRPNTLALALDLQARAGSIRLGLGWATVADKARVAEQHQRAAEAYQAAGNVREHFAARHRLANLHRSMPFPRIELAHSQLNAIATDALAQQHPIAAAEAILEGAVLSFRMAHVGKEMGDTAAALAAFESAETQFAQAGHAEGQARTLAQFAEVLLEHGYVNGVAIAHEALTVLEAAGDVVARQALWRELHKWHLQHGDPAAAKVARNAAQQLSHEMMFQLTQVVDRQAHADMAFRAGHVAEALSLLTQAGADPAHPHFTGPNAAPWLIRASVLTQAGRTEEAIQELRNVIAHLSSAGVSPFLADAWSQLGHALLGQNDAEAVKCLLNSVQAARQLGDDVGAAKLLSQTAWLQTQQRYRVGQKPILTSEIEATFDAARSQLQEHRTLDAWLELGSLCGLRGQACFLAGNIEGANQWFNHAEALYTELSLKPQIAFTEVQQGLIFLQVGRSRGLAGYNPALPLFERARQLFDDADLRGIAWRAVFYKGLCEFEAGYWEDAGSQIQADRWHNALVNLENAADRIDQLRGFAADVSGLLSQSPRVAFMVDKRVVYSTALKLSLEALGNPSEGLRWVERSKSRSLLDLLAETNLPLSEPLASNALVQQERSLAARKHATSEASEALELQAQIDVLLEQMAGDTATAEYVDLRRGDVVDWPQLRELLKSR